MHLLIATAAGRMADEVQQEMRMADLKHIEGMRNHDRASLQALFIQLGSTETSGLDRLGRLSRGPLLSLAGVQFPR